MADDDYKYIYTKRRVYRLPKDATGIPIEEAFPGAEMPAFLKGALVYDTPRGRIIARQETDERSGQRSGKDEAEPQQPVSAESSEPPANLTPASERHDNPMRFFRKGASKARNRQRDDELER
jgi:hypothetical protein